MNDDEQHASHPSSRIHHFSILSILLILSIHFFKQATRRARGASDGATL